MNAELCGRQLALHIRRVINEHDLVGDPEPVCHARDFRTGTPLADKTDFEVSRDMSQGLNENLMALVPAEVGHNDSGGWLHINAGSPVRELNAIGKQNYAFWPSSPPERFLLKSWCVDRYCVGSGDSPCEQTTQERQVEIKDFTTKRGDSL